MLVDKDPGVLDILDDQDRTPLHAASHAGSKESVRILLSKGAKVQRLTTEIEGDIISIGSAVHTAAAAGHADCLRLLVAAASPDAINGGDCFDRSPLHLAATAGHANCLKVRIHLHFLQPLDDSTNRVPVVITKFHNYELRRLCFGARVYSLPCLCALVCSLLDIPCLQILLPFQTSAIWC